MKVKKNEFLVSKKSFKTNTNVDSYIDFGNIHFTEWNVSINGQENLLFY